MSSRTAFLSRLIGLFCILIALSLISHRQATVEAVAGILQDPSLILVLGVVTLAAGLAMVLAHNVWSGGVRAVVVTLVGWIAVMKGLLLLFLPPDLEAGLILRQLHYDQFFYLYMTISLALGIYLTYGGFASKTQA
jgi:hypothetical protein